MENIKTEEELIKENKELADKIVELTTVIQNSVKMLAEGKEYNVKLAYSTRLFGEMHFTLEEKMVIAKEIDMAPNAEQVQNIYNKYISQALPTDTESNDFKWSQAFTRDLEKYYLEYRGYNPFDSINEAANVLRAHFAVEEELAVSDDPLKITKLRQKWEEGRLMSSRAIDEIVSITNEILKK